ncbi:MAG: cupin domain-containing protein, partial [Candidatus Binatia bacterium]
MVTEAENFWSRATPYESWIESLGVPVYRGYYIEDPRKLDLGWWEERRCSAAFLQLAGQEGVTGAYVTEIPPGETSPPFRMALDEVIYVLQGRGLTTVEAGAAKKTFEWEKRSLFRIPGGRPYQLSNVQGNQPVRLLHCNYLPLALSALPDPKFFFTNHPADSESIEGKDGADFYSQARVMRLALPGRDEERNVWSGNFFPDMSAWDRLDPYKRRG